MTLDLNRPNSAALFARAQAAMPGGNTRYSAYTPPHPIYLIHGQGAYVHDADGRRYLDLQNNFTTLIHGHCFAPVHEALKRQLDLGACFSNPTESEIRLAELLCERVPYFEGVRFVNSGTEAVMTAIKAARAATGRVKVAKAEGGYHGAYDFVEVSLDPAPETWGTGSPPSVPFCRGTPDYVLENTVVFPVNDRDAAERALLPHVDELSCVIIDPIPARVAAEPLDPAFLSWLRGFTRHHGILLISDEVLSFRCSFQGASTPLGLEPDLCTFGKIVGGGLPIGAIAGRSATMRLFDPRHGKPAVPQAGTFSANPLSMVAGTAAMAQLDQAQFARLEALGRRARAGMRALAAESGPGLRVTGSASMFRLHFVAAEPRDYRSGYHDADARARREAFVHACWGAGLLIAPTGLGVLSTAMTERDIEVLLDGFSRAVRQTKATNARLAGNAVQAGLAKA